jgi:5-methylcytosine-specific restriction endonuclease McrA
LKKNENGDNLCCKEWLEDWNKFFVWYKKRFTKQDGLCEYCHLPGDTIMNYKKHFRKGRRGFNLEVDRKDPKGKYSPENCVLACYPCNNAKSDVFSYNEFLMIGKVIGRIKKHKAFQGD